MPSKLEKWKAGPPMVVIINESMIGLAYCGCPGRDRLNTRIIRWILMNIILSIGRLQLHLEFPQQQHCIRLLYSIYLSYRTFSIPPFSLSPPFPSTYCVTAKTLILCFVDPGSAWILLLLLSPPTCTMVTFRYGWRISDLAPPPSRHVSFGTMGTVSSGASHGRCRRN